MEEDAGKSIHGTNEPFSYVDLNRAGTPRLAVVTEPDLRSAEEVDAFMSGMRQLVRYLGVSDGNMQEGSLRCDVNISVRPEGQAEYGQRCEVKNLNSMRYARQAIAYEVKRQIKLVEAGKRVLQQTRQFDPKTGSTSALRDKEDAHAYRYFPEPDLPPIRVDGNFIEASINKEQQLPWDAYHYLKDTLGLTDYDADLLSSDHCYFEVFKKYSGKTTYTDSLSKLFQNKIIPWLEENEVDANDFPLSPDTINAYLELVANGKVAASSANANLFPALLDDPTADPAAKAEELSLIQNKDEDFLEQLVDQVITANPGKVKAYQKGKKGLIGFFMGEIMKASKGQAGPKETQDLLRRKLDS
jgi:aspartyl-tRNA(Asn)/glutamyl-tRNA(Gln) amidotransferase subunit B